MSKNNPSNKFSHHTFSLFDAEFNDPASHLCMIKDYERCQGFFTQLQAHSKDKIVIDFGAGTGILGLYAGIQGAKEVWFIENQLNLHEIIHDLAKKNNLKKYHVVGDFTQIPKDLDVGVIVSETLGDTGIERNYTYLYSQLIARYPNAICIPDALDIYYSGCYVKEVDIENEYLKNFPVNLESRYLYPFPGMRPTRLEGIEVKDNLLFEFNLRRYPTGRDIRKIVELKKDPKDNFLSFYWKAKCNGEVFATNTPARSKDNFNHWQQLGLKMPDDKTLGVRVDHLQGPFVLCGNPHPDFINNPEKFDNQNFEPMEFKFNDEKPKESGFIHWTT